MRRGERPRPDDYRRAAELREELRRFLRVSERVARRHGLTPQRYTLLLMIKGAPDGSERSTVTGLSERLQLAQSTVTELVRRAEDAGLIHREPSPRDGRVVFLGLTGEGERRLAETVSELGLERKRLEALLAEPAGRQRRS
ncbi:MAG: MarR family transcriptional regulator [Thermoleophilia bacterium]|nr:MarR family transcriptional regulator [Thermoleophilia bacterium]